MRTFQIITFLATLILASCGPGGEKNSTSSQRDIKVPTFSTDSAYTYIAKQVEFGPRVPGTEAHVACGDWLVEKLKGFGAAVIEQKTTAVAYDGKDLPVRNIIARFQPEKRNRILLMAHWDSRPYADHDPDPNNYNTPIPGANDGGSGVGVLLEMARHFGTESTLMGVDIILFDTEDYGVPDQSDIAWQADTWCLGSQYWAENLHTADYAPRFGILLDMVGAHQAVFTQEEVSVHFAKNVVEKVWNQARELGYGHFFSWDKTTQIVDDHRYVNQIAEIPSIVIVQYDHATPSHFGPYWHTLGDNLSVISKETLKAVGETVMYVVYREEV